jgi:opacity protein-like surface antigen
MKLQSNLKSLMVLAVIGTALISTEVKSQSKSPIHIGFNGGASFSNLSLSKAGLDSKYSLGYHGGLFTRLDISDLYLQGELLYAQRKSKLENGNLGTQTAKWNSIEVPLLIGYKLLKSEQATLRVFGGGVYSYVLKDKASILKQVAQSFDRFDKSNIGYQGGLGVDFGRLSLDLKYEGSLTKLSKEFNAKPNAFQASIGFMIF